MKSFIEFIITAMLVLFAAGSALPQNQSDMNIKVDKLDIQTATFDDVLAVFGNPLRLLWGDKTFSKDNLPEIFIADYPQDFGVVIENLRVSELRFGEVDTGYVFAEKLRIGSSLETVLEVLGRPKRIVEGGEPAWADRVLYKDMEGMKGYCYYSRKDRGVRIFFKDNKIIALYLFPPSDAPDGREAERRARKLTKLPKYDPESDSPFKVDLRDRDLTSLDLRTRLNDLMFADFDDRTVWPAADRMPPKFDHKKIMDKGRNPGLGLRALHRDGITGRGISIAIIDQPLNRDHVEFKERLRFYEEVNIRPSTDPQMHGAAVASIAVGKTVGVAPEADLYYIAAFAGDFGEDGVTHNFAYKAKAIRRILELNDSLPKERKIRVIALQIGWSSSQKGYVEITEAAAKAKAQGILVICSCVDDVHGFKFHGLGRSPYADPDLWDSYEPGLWWADDFYSMDPGQLGRRLMVPMDSRTTAAPDGPEEYVFYRIGGWSWSIPYIAGIYALAAQADSMITPDRFWKTALDTGRTVEVRHQGKKFKLGPVVDPAALVDALKD